MHLYIQQNVTCLVLVTGVLSVGSANAALDSIDWCGLELEVSPLSGITLPCLKLNPANQLVTLYPLLFL